MKGATDTLYFSFCDTAVTVTPSSEILTNSVHYLLQKVEKYLISTRCVIDESQKAYKQLEFDALKMIDKYINYMTSLTYSFPVYFRIKKGRV